MKDGMSHKEMANPKGDNRDISVNRARQSIEQYSGDRRPDRIKKLQSEDDKAGRKTS